MKGTEIQFEIKTSNSTNPDDYKSMIEQIKQKRKNSEKSINKLS